MRAGRGASAQASIELLAALPALALAAALALQLLLVGYSLTIADGAAEAGALAGSSGHDEQRAARNALPDWARDLSHLTAFMSYSAFLGECDLVAERRRYEDLISRAEDEMP